MRESTKTELHYEDLEKLPVDEVARIAEWLTEKVRRAPVARAPAGRLARSPQQRRPCSGGGRQAARCAHR
jgi:hypothetical protein